MVQVGVTPNYSFVSVFLRKITYKLKGTSFEVQEKNLHGKIFIAYVSLHMFLYYKCDYDGDIVISCYVFARMCVVQGLSCIGLYLVVTTAWHLAALWRMCLQHAFCFVFDASCFSVSIFKVSCFFLNNSCFDVSCFYVSCFS